MRIEYKCLECALSSYCYIVDKQDINQEKKDSLVRWFLDYLSNVDFDMSAPEIARAVHLYLRTELGLTDLYAQEKKIDNDKVIANLDSFMRTIESSDDEVLSALKLAISGNVIDLGTDHGMDYEIVISRALSKNITVDESSYLTSRIKTANNILYLADNAGEIVFDKIFIDTLVNNNIVDREKITIAVRGAPILNDATIEDAEYIGLTEDYRVISNGDCSPGTCFKHTSEEFNTVYSNADLIISKGQGNFETLSEVVDKEIFFLLISKCSLVAERLKNNIGDLVCQRNLSFSGDLLEK